MEGSISIFEGGRIILINNILDVLPTYVMSLFPLPTKVEKRLDSHKRNFLWQGCKETRCFHLVRWKSVMSSKKE